MPAYNFQARFAPAVEAGTKRQTVRRKRKRPTRVGDTLYLYTGLRTTLARLLRKAPCVTVRPIYIGGYGILVLDGAMLEWDEDLGAFARADGFESYQEFYDFFETTYGLPFEGEVLTW